MLELNDEGLGVSRLQVELILVLEEELLEGGRAILGNGELEFVGELSTKIDSQGPNIE